MANRPLAKGVAGVEVLGQTVSRECSGPLRRSRSGYGRNVLMTTRRAQSDIRLISDRLVLREFAVTDEDAVNRPGFDRDSLLGLGDQTGQVT